MAFDIKSLTGDSSRDKRPIIGAVQVNRTFRHHKADYECAAWWEDHEANLGVHPVYLGRSYHSPKLLTITAEVKGKVINDWFPALWGGVAVSREPYKPKHIGEACTIYVQKDVVHAIEMTGNSPDSDVDWFIHPSWWKVFTEEALTELKEDYRRLPEFWNEWDKLDPNNFHSKMDGRWKFDDEYRSKIGMVAYFGGLMEKWARRIEKINWQAQHHNSDSEYQRKLFAKNTAWTKAIPIQINE